MKKYLHQTTMEIFIWLLFQKWRPGRDLFSINPDYIEENYIYKPGHNFLYDLRNHKELGEFLETSGFDYYNQGGFWIDLKEREKLVKFLKDYIQDFENDYFEPTPENYSDFQIQLEHFLVILKELYKHRKKNFVLNIEYQYKNLPEADFRKLRILELILFLYFHKDKLIEIKDCQTTRDSSRKALVDINIKLLKTPDELFSIFMLNRQIVDSQIVDHKSVINSLTSREKEVFKCLLDGKKDGEIATILVIAISTVNSHIKKIFNKLEVNSRPQLIAKYIFFKNTLN